MSRQIFLGKNGQTFGPYTVEDLNKFQTSGQIRDYSWIWDSESPSWKSLDTLAPPPPPVENAKPVTPTPPPQTSAPVYTPPTVTTPTPKATTGRNLRPAFFSETSPLEVTCHDRTEVIMGQIYSISETGCCFISKDANTKRCFAEQAVVFIDLFDPKSKKAMKTAVKLIGITQNEGRWAYQMQWSHCPELIRET